MSPGGGTGPFDPSRPAPARVYDYLLGGKDNFAADRALAERLKREGYPDIAGLARANRQFLLKTVVWLSSLGVSQFIDAGCGMPLRPSVAETARDCNQDAAVLLADRDLLVITHVTAMESGPRTAGVLADIRDPGKVLASDEARAVLNPNRPFAVLFGGTLSGMPAGEATETVKGWIEMLAAGSAIVISCATYADPGLGQRMSDLFAPAAEWHNHTLGDITAFFGPLRIIHNKVMDVRYWPLACDEVPAAMVAGGVGFR